MKWVADESVDGPIAYGLRAERHVVSYVPEFDSGIDDDHVLSVTQRDGALLLTADKDFGELAIRQHRSHHGIALLRLHGLTPERKAEIVVAAVAKHGPEMVGSITVTSPDTCRIRKPELPIPGISSDSR